MSDSRSPVDSGRQVDRYTSPEKTLLARLCCGQASRLRSRSYFDSVIPDNLPKDQLIKQQQVVMLHFVTDEQGKVNAVEIRQPGTVHTAKCK